MADTKISDLTALTGANLASGDKFAVADVSVTTSKSITAAELGTGLRAVGGLVGGSTGATDKSLLMSNGTGGTTVQASANLTQDSSNNLILGDSTGARELWFSSVATAPVLRRNGTSLRLIGNTGSEVEMQAGVFQQQDATNPSAFQNVQIANNKTISFSDGVDYAQGIAKGSANGLRITDGSTGVGSLQFSRPVEANTDGSGAPNVLAATESNGALTNEGTTAENYHTLPSAAAGLSYTFVVQDTDGVRITAAAGDTIRPGTVAASASAGFIRCATQGAAITLLAINATEWMAVSMIGTWTVDV